jgi:hypothetical protein
MQHPRPMQFDSPHADAEPVRDNLVPFALDEAIEHLAFAPGELRYLARSFKDAAMLPG